jgi:hypothetical protein
MSLYVRIGLLLAILFCTVITEPHVMADNPSVGTYSLAFRFDQLDTSTSLVVGEVSIEASFPPGSGFAWIPLPFSVEKAEAFVIEPRSDTALILHGDIRPERTFGLVGISLQDHDTNFIFVIRRVKFALEQTVETRSGKSTRLLLRNAHASVQEILPEGPIPKLTEIRLKGEFLGETVPGSTPIGGSEQERVVRFAMSSPPNDVIVYYNEARGNLPILYGFLSVLGLLLGFFVAPVIVSNRGSAVITLILSLVSLVVIGLILGLVLTPDQRLNDTTTVVTIGTAIGAVVGTSFRSAWALWKLRGV